MTKFGGNKGRQRVAAVCASCLLGGLTSTTIAVPAASAAPDCSPDGVNNTVSSVRSSADQYLDSHPGANQAVTAAFNQPRPQAEANLRGYFSSHPQEYYDLRGILQPIGDTQRECNTAVLPPDLESAYNVFMAG